MSDVYIVVLNNIPQYNPQMSSVCCHKFGQLCTVAAISFGTNCILPKNVTNFVYMLKFIIYLISKIIMLSGKLNINSVHKDLQWKAYLYSLRKYWNVVKSSNSALS